MPNPYILPPKPKPKTYRKSLLFLVKVILRQKFTLESTKKMKKQKKIHFIFRGVDIAVEIQILIYYKK